MAALTANSIKMEGPLGGYPSFGAGVFLGYAAGGAVHAEGNTGPYPTLGARGYGYSPGDIVTIVAQYGSGGGGVSLF